MESSSSGGSPSSSRSALHSRAFRLEWFTVSWNVLEPRIAVTVGILSGSTALVAFGADSFIEVLSAAVLLWRLYAAGPNATLHKHGRAERRALYLVAVTFGLLALYASTESRWAHWASSEPEASTVGLILALLSVFVMPLLAYATQPLGRQMGSEALEADAIETWVCAYLSFALLAGIGLHLALGWWWADPVAALAMVPVILWQGWKTWKEVSEN